MGEGRRVYALTARGELGPFTAEEMRDEIAGGRVQPGDQVRTATGAMVGTAGEFAGLRTPLRVKPPRSPTAAEGPPPRPPRQPTAPQAPSSRAPLLIVAGVLAAAVTAVALTLANRSPPPAAPGPATGGAVPATAAADPRRPSPAPAPVAEPATAGTATAPADAAADPLDAAPASPFAIEGETLRVIEKAGHVQPQQWPGDSAGAHLWWCGGTKPGDRLVLGFSATTAGTYEVLGRFLKAPDYGIATFAVNDQAAGPPLDFYHPSVMATGEIPLGTAELAAGENRLTITLAGANPAAIRTYMLGLDRLRLRPAAPAPSQDLVPGLHASYHALFTGFTNELASRRPTGTQPGWGPTPVVTTRPQTGAIRWQGFLKVPATGAWRLHLTATTGARIWIDGKDTVGTDSGKTASVDRPLTAGLHPLVIAHRFVAGPDRLLAEWEGPGTPRQPLPLAAFRQRPGSDGIPSGGVLWEQWPGMNDLSVFARITLPAERWQVVGELSAPSNAGECFLARMRAVLQVPATGDYRFWIAADDRAKLRLSDDASPARARDIARCNGAHRPDEFTDDVRSQPIRLEQGRPYFIEVWHAEDRVLDHAVVAWEGPGIPRQVVPGSCLTPWVP